jgi:hypothetical protein
MWYYCAVTGESKKIVFTSGATEKITNFKSCTMVIVMILLHSWIGGNGFSTLMIPKLQITRGFATHDLQFGHHFHLWGLQKPLNHD